MLNKILQTLMFKKNIKTAQLAREIGMPKQTLNRIVKGDCENPHLKNLIPIADYFSISVEQLKGEQPLPDKLIDIHLPSAKPKAKTIPLLSWNDLNDLNSVELEKLEGTIFVAPDLSDRSFATLMPDSSMSPIFDKGCILIFDPQKKPSDRSFVLVNITESNTIVLRQLLIDMDHKYLKPLNPDLNVFKMRLLSDKDVIIATLVESRQMYNDELSLGSIHGI